MVECTQLKIILKKEAVMSTEMLSYFLKNEDVKTRLGFQIALQCAPFLKGLKVSCLITMDSKSYGELDEVFSGIGIAWQKLSESDGRCLVLFYRAGQLREYLLRPEIYKLLCEYGYEGMDPEEMIGRLADRVGDISAKGLGFPHEIGAFLGYPIEDVRGFIENQGRKCLMTGYWKVYGNPASARMLFKEYDRAKDCAVNEFLTGKTIREIAM